MRNIIIFLTGLSLCFMGVLPTAASDSIDIRLQPVPIKGNIEINAIGEGVLSNLDVHEVCIKADYNGESLVRYSLETEPSNYQITPSWLNFAVFTMASTSGKRSNSEIRLRNTKSLIEYRVKLYIRAKKVVIERYEDNNRTDTITEACNLKPYQTYIFSATFSSYDNIVSILEFDQSKDSFEDLFRLELTEIWPIFPLEELSTFSVYVGGKRSETKFWDQSLKIIPSQP